MKLRSLTVGLTLLAAGTVIGTTAQQFASADVASGDRPVLVPIETCRITDTRTAPNTVGPRTAPLGAADTMTIDAQEPGTDCTGKIPAGATALSLNVTALDATSNSFLTIWPDGDRPDASALNPAPDTRVFNAVTTQLASDQTFKIFNNRGSVNVFVDINGYYENHNHDDRYFTKTETTDEIAGATEAISVTQGTAPSFSNRYPRTASRALMVTTTTAGRLVIDASFSRLLNCGFGSSLEWYYLTIDGVPVESSAVLKSAGTTEVVPYRGVSATTLPAGTYSINIGGECFDPDDMLISSGTTVSAFESANVIVVP